MYICNKIRIKQYHSIINHYLTYRHNRLKCKIITSTWVCVDIIWLIRLWVCRNSTWIDVDINPPIGLQTYNCCMMLSDVHGDNDNKFVVVDFGSGTSSPLIKVWFFSSSSTIMHFHFVNDRIIWQCIKFILNHIRFSKG